MRTRTAQLWSSIIATLVVSTACAQPDFGRDRGVDGDAIVCDFEEAGVSAEDADGEELGHVSLDSLELIYESSRLYAASPAFHSVRATLPNARDPPTR